MIIWRLSITCLIPKATNTHSEYVILVFSHETMVKRTRLNVTLYKHCVSRWNVVSKTPNTKSLSSQALRDLKFSLRCN